MLQDSNKNNLETEYLDILESLTAFKKDASQLLIKFKHYEKNIKKELKRNEKLAAKNRSKGNRKPSGFAKPSKVSDELCEFMGKDSGTHIARTEVTQYLIKYIRDNKLADKKIINPDTKLKSLLGIDTTKSDSSAELTYFTIQGYMNKHFIKNTTALEKI